MEQDTSRASDLPQPLRAVTSHLRRLPGAGQVGRAAGGALDALGAVSPRGRRMAVYAGAGVLGVAGLVEWPVALTGAAVAWLTRPRGTEGEWARAADSATALTDDTSAGEGPPADPERGLLAGAAGAGTGGSGSRRGGTAAAAGGDGAGRGRGAEVRGPAGPGDRLTPSRHRQVREQPAKVGDTTTASALRQVAEATTQHAPRSDRDGTSRHTG